MRSAASMLLPLRLALLAVLAYTPTAASAQSAHELVQRINAYRQWPGICDGHQPERAPALTEDARLSRVRTRKDTTMRAALREVDYQAAAVRAITLTGASTARAAMDALRQRYCAALADPRYRDVGVSYEQGTWRLVLAQPLLPDDIGDWRAAGHTMLEHVNDARAQPRRCGTAAYAAAAPLAWDERLAAAALAHSRDMAENDYFSHASPDGARVAARVDAAGYNWQRVGENIAADVRSAEQAVAGWVSSPRHCANLMDPHFTQMGAAYAVNPDSGALTYWTQVLGAPSRRHE